MIEHPDITKTIRTGYPEPERKYYGHDFFGLTVLEGEEIMELDEVIEMKIKAGAWTRLTSEQKAILLSAYARDLKGGEHR